MFDKKMPDLNWDNPETRKEYFDAMNYWLEKGIAGYKIDALSHISKPKIFKDYKTDKEYAYGDMHVNGPHMKEYIHLLNRVIKGHSEDNVMLAEMA